MQTPNDFQIAQASQVIDIDVSLAKELNRHRRSLGDTLGDAKIDHTFHLVCLNAPLPVGWLQEGAGGVGGTAKVRCDGLGHGRLMLLPHLNAAGVAWCGVVCARTAPALACLSNFTLWNCSLVSPSNHEPH